VRKEEDYLHDQFSAAILRFCVKSSVSDAAWLEIVRAYSAPHRHYHNLHHLYNMLENLEAVKSEILNFDASVFALFYHDIICDPAKTGNEKKSSQLAGKRLQDFGVDERIRNKVVDLILATEKHERSDDHDLNCFLDADLSILGSEESVYRQYSVAIRNEYENVPEFLYRPGRRKVLEHFLSMPTIFKTPFFQHEFEDRARLNMRLELNGLIAP
jgi:predicted metal-dependent HD superfamily phosphohydrolase